MTAASKHMTGTDDDLLRIVRTDKDAVRRREAATELVLRYRDAVYLWCFRYTRDPERALDLSQDVLVGVWEKIGSFEGRSKFSSWLFSVTRNRCIDASRRVDVLGDEPVTDDLPDRSPLPDASMQDGEDEEWLRGLIRTKLDALEQNVIWLRCIERIPVDEITRMLDIGGTSGARAVLQRARRKLRAAAGTNDG